MKNHLSIRDLVEISIFAAIIFVLEQILSFLPNIQITFFLIILLSVKLKFLNVVLVILIHVLLDSLYTGSLGFLYTPFIFLGYFIILVTLKTIFKNIRSNIGLACLSIIYALIYSLLFTIPFVLVLKLDFITYLIADIPFQILLASSSFITTLWLYNPLSKAFELLYKMR